MSGQSSALSPRSDTGWTRGPEDDVQAPNQLRSVLQTSSLILSR